VAFDCSCGSSFVLGGHLWVIVAELFGSPKQVMIVNLTSKKPHSDCTVILSSENHRFIKHDTVISYADAGIVQSEYLIKRIQQGDFKQHDNFNHDVIRIIQQGLIDSPRTPKYIKEIFIDLQNKRS